MFVRFTNALLSVTSIAKEYCRLLKYGDSLYRCKLLKKAALGRLVYINYLFSCKYISIPYVQDSS